LIVTSWIKYRGKKCRSSGSGKFFFSPSVYDRGLLWTLEGYSIRVTDPESDLAVPCGSVLGPGLNEVHSGQQVNIGDTAKYFLVVLVKQGDSVRNRLVWSSTQRPMGFPLSIRIALIPVLPNVDECKQIEDPRLDDDCRQLNTEAKAIEVGQRE
jgi:hypothetical protein